MPKPTRGLPESFRLEVSKEAMRGPVQLGTYDDEFTEPATRSTVSPAPQIVRQSPAVAEARRIPSPTASLAATRVMSSSPPPDAPSEAVEPVSSPPAGGRHFRRVSRKQLNLTPETLRMIDELIDQMKHQSVQKDLKGSEMFQALVAALYDAREYIDMGSVPPRGRWGTPTANAFPVALKNAFHDAIQRWSSRYRF